jgi:hypothetical protein
MLRPIQRVLHPNCAMEGKRTRIYTLQCEMNSGRTLRETFAIFEDPYNLAKITPPWLNFRVTSSERVQMRKGAEIQYVIRWFRLPIRWKTRITEYDPPHKFVDEQERGPYALWRDHHTFTRLPRAPKSWTGSSTSCLLGCLAHLSTRPLFGASSWRFSAIARVSLAKCLAARAGSSLRHTFVDLTRAYEVAPCSRKFRSRLLRLG